MQELENILEKIKEEARRDVSLSIAEVWRWTDKCR